MGTYKTKASPRRLMKVSMKRVNNDIILLYRLTRERAPDRESPYQYSLSVTKVDCGGSRRELKRIADVSRSYTEAQRIFKLISRGCVMPSTIEEIVEELICI